MIFLLEWWNKIPTLRGSDDVRNRSLGCPQIPVFKSYKQTEYNHPLNSSRGMPGRTDHVTSFSRANTLGPGSSVGVKRGITNITRIKKSASEASHAQFASFFALTPSPERSLLIPSSLSKKYFGEIVSRLTYRRIKKPCSQHRASQDTDKLTR